MCYFGCESAIFMRSLFLVVMALGTTFGADPEAIQRKATALVHEADQAVASNHNSEAEEGYKAAIAQCDLLPPEKYHCKTDVQWKLGRFYSHVNDRLNGEATYKQRLDTLVANQEAGAPPDLDIGIALFDLQDDARNSVELCGSR